MKRWSRKWISSKNPKKQRKYRANAPLHVRRKIISAHLSKLLRKEIGKRAVPVRKEDETKIVRGNSRGMTGKISRVDTKKMKIYIEGVKTKKISGQEVDVPIDPSNVIIIRLHTDDKRRIKSLKRGRKTEVKQPEKHFKAMTPSAS